MIFYPHVTTSADHELGFYTANSSWCMPSAWFVVPEKSNWSNIAWDLMSGYRVSGIRLFVSELQTTRLTNHVRRGIPESE